MVVGAQNKSDCSVSIQILHLALPSSQVIFNTFLSATLQFSHAPHQSRAIRRRRQLWISSVRTGAAGRSPPARAPFPSPRAEARSLCPSRLHPASLAGAAGFASGVHRVSTVQWKLGVCFCCVSWGLKKVDIFVWSIFYRGNKLGVVNKPCLPEPVPVRGMDASTVPAHAEGSAGGAIHASKAESMAMANPMPCL